MELYSQEDLDFVNSQLDTQLMERWGFEVIRNASSQVMPEVMLDSLTGKGRTKSAQSGQEQKVLIAASDIPADTHRTVNPWSDPVRMKRHRRLLTYLQ